MKYKIASDKLFIFCFDKYKSKDKLISLSGLDNKGNVVYEYRYINA